MAHVSVCTALFARGLLDVLAQSGEEGVLQILRQSFRKEGSRFLFKGWTPAFMRLGPNTVLLFVFMEVCLLVHLGRGIKDQPTFFSN
jgi:hypothetical protein